MSLRRYKKKMRRLYRSQKRRNVHYGFWPAWAIDDNFKNGTIGRISGFNFIECDLFANQP